MNISFVKADIENLKARIKVNEVRIMKLQNRNKLYQIKIKELKKREAN